MILERIRVISSSKDLITIQIGVCFSAQFLWKYSARYDIILKTVKVFEQLKKWDVSSFD